MLALAHLFDSLDAAFKATIVAINRLTPTIIEVVVKAPYAAEKFSPGQFYRVQNYEAYALVIEGTSLASEAIALTGAEVDKGKWHDLVDCFGNGFIVQALCIVAYRR